MDRLTGAVKAWLWRLEKAIFKRLFCDGPGPIVTKHKFESRILDIPEVYTDYLHCVWCDQDFWSI